MSEEDIVDLSFLLNQFGKSTEEVIDNCEKYGAVLLPLGMQTPDIYGGFETVFDARVHMNTYFRQKDYIAFSAIGFNFYRNEAVECIISLGTPEDLGRYHSEEAVLKTLSQSFQREFQNGRIQADDSGNRACTWLSWGQLISLVSYADSPESSGVHISIQIRDSKNHPHGRELTVLYDASPRMKG